MAPLRSTAGIVQFFADLAALPAPPARTPTLQPSPPSPDITVGDEGGGSSINLGVIAAVVVLVALGGAAGCYVRRGGKGRQGEGSLPPTSQTVAMFINPIHSVLDDTSAHEAPKPMVVQLDEARYVSSTSDIARAEGDVSAESRYAVFRGDGSSASGATETRATAETPRYEDIHGGIGGAVYDVAGSIDPASEPPLGASKAHPTGGGLRRPNNESQAGVYSGLTTPSANVGDDASQYQVFRDVNV